MPKKRERYKYILDIEGIPFCVQEVNNKKIQQATREQDTIGCTFPEKQIIWVDESLGNQIKKRTIIHEAIHCWAFLNNYDKILDEKIINSLERFIYSFYVHNQELWKD